MRQPYPPTDLTAGQKALCEEIDFSPMVAKNAIAVARQNNTVIMVRHVNPGVENIFDFLEQFAAKPSSIKGKTKKSDNPLVNGSVYPLTETEAHDSVTVPAVVSVSDLLKHQEKYSFICLGNTLHITRKQGRGEPSDQLIIYLSEPIASGVSNRSVNFHMPDWLPQRFHGLIHLDRTKFQLHHYDQKNIIVPVWKLANPSGCAIVSDADIFAYYPLHAIDPEDAKIYSTVKKSPQQTSGKKKVSKSTINHPAIQQLANRTDALFRLHGLSALANEFGGVHDMVYRLGGKLGSLSAYDLFIMLQINLIAFKEALKKYGEQYRKQNSSTTPFADLSAIDKKICLENRKKALTSRFIALLNGGGAQVIQHGPEVNHPDPTMVDTTQKLEIFTPNGEMHVLNPDVKPFKDINDSRAYYQYAKTVPAIADSIRRSSERLKQLPRAEQIIINESFPGLLEISHEDPDNSKPIVTVSSFCNKQEEVEAILNRRPSCSAINPLTGGKAPHAQKHRENNSDDFATSLGGSPGGSPRTPSAAAELTTPLNILSPTTAPSFILGNTKFSTPISPGTISEYVPTSSVTVAPSHKTTPDAKSDESTPLERKQKSGELTPLPETRVQDLSPPPHTVSTAPPSQQGPKAGNTPIRCGTYLDPTEATCRKLDYDEAPVNNIPVPEIVVQVIHAHPPHSPAPATRGRSASLARPTIPAPPMAPRASSATVRRVPQATKNPVAFFTGAGMRVIQKRNGGLQRGRAPLRGLMWTASEPQSSPTKNLASIFVSHYNLAPKGPFGL